MSNIRTLGTLAVLLGFASISTDLFLPALPTMAEALGAGPGQMELVVSTYLAGFGFGQLLWGPISDRFGRRGPILLGVAVFALGSAGCALATAPWQIILWRIVQALGASAGVALARAMIRDLYERDRAAKILSGLMTVMAVAPLVGPSLGAAILKVAPWQAIFWLLVGFGLATLVAVMALPESLAPDKRTKGALSGAFRDYALHLTNRGLMTRAGALGFYYLGVFAGIAGAPFAYITHHGLSPQAYALVFGSGIVGLMAANMLNARLVTTLGAERMLRIGTLGAAVTGLAFAAVTATDWQGVAGLVAVNLGFTAMNGLIAANAVAGALASVKHAAGSASAVVGALQYGGGMAGAALVAALADGTPWPMGLVVALGGCGSLLCAWAAGRQVT
ncbi:multidrug effflux MFS transporter [Stagnihabitans tardus]|uniref:Bcr/CflA family efflux transporter n=1 Tax=Stagnihabitans tardus TaxID=2699202 RepID=A0AAE4YBY3_9RHOB|nr:multidrug effflux MFS transporter [Stagnihabitans tardus]NBZ89847.1 Bcr/CflA family efflux MFS transporter [Stagnihabitans tardus]